MFVDRHIPAVRKHGYLLATVVMKPERGNPSPGRPAPLR